MPKHREGTTPSEREALNVALAELERLSQRDLNHDGFGDQPTDPKDCRICRAIEMCQEALGYGD